MLSGDQGTLGDLVDRVCAIAGRKPPRFTMPSVLLKTSAPLGPVIGPLMGFPPNLRELITAPTASPTGPPTPRPAASSASPRAISTRACATRSPRLIDVTPLASSPDRLSGTSDHACIHVTVVAIDREAHGVGLARPGRDRTNGAACGIDVAGPRGGVVIHDHSSRRNPRGCPVDRRAPGRKLILDGGESAVRGRFVEHARVCQPSRMGEWRYRWLGSISRVPTLNGAFWNARALSGRGGAAVAATLAVTPSLSDRHFSLWLDMSAPERTGTDGCELRFTQTALPDVYDVALSRWQAGTPTVLALQPAYVFAEQARSRSPTRARQCRRGQIPAPATACCCPRATPHSTEG